MASDYLLLIDGIKGESPDVKHKGEIEIESFSFGETQPGSHAAGGGGGAGKVQMQDFHFVSNLSKASPELFLACAEGRHIKKAVLTVRKAGKDQQEYLKVTLSDLLISSYQTSGSEAANALPMEQISLNFSKIEFAYAPQKADGTLETALKVGWDLKANKKV